MPSSASSPQQSVHATGAHVTTVVAGAHHAVSDEPERVVVEVHPGGALGVSFASGGVVSQVTMVMCFLGSAIDVRSKKLALPTIVCVLWQIRPCSGVQPVRHASWGVPC